jgi:hypothetical protein
VEVLRSSHHPFVKLPELMGRHPPDPVSEVDDVEVEFRFDNEERRERRGEERRGSSAIGSGDVARSNAGNRPGGEIAISSENFRIPGIQ